jgi:hypothetical protein
LLFVSGALVGLLAGGAAKPRANRNSFPEANAPVSRREKVDEGQGAVPQSRAASEVPAHEQSEVNLAMLGGVLVVLALGAFIIQTSLWWWVNMKKGGSREEEVTRWQASARPMPEGLRDFPKLQISPQRDLRGFLARQEQALSASGRDTSGATRIPIEQAIDIVSERGSSKWRATHTKQISPLELQQQRGNGAQDENH